MIKRLVSLTPEVNERLGKEKNASALVDSLVAKYYGINITGDSGPAKERQAIQAVDITLPELPIRLAGRPATQTATGDFSFLDEPENVPEPIEPANKVDGITSTTCPDCGGPKLANMATCVSCSLK